MDIGSTSDKTAIADIVELPDNTLLVADIAMLHKASYEHQLQILKEKHEKMHYKAGYIDQNGIGSALSEFATKQVSSLIRGYTWTSSNKTPAYENLRAKIFDHKLKFAAHLKPLITQDFQNVHRVVNEAGNVKYEAGRDSNGHSDATSAVVLGLEAAREHPT